MSTEPRSNPDLTAGLDVEHITGSMPAADADRQRARDAWYQLVADGRLNHSHAIAKELALMATSPLTDILLICERQLGWMPETPVYRSRALMHSILSKAMTKRGHSVADLRLAVAWCQRRHRPIVSPLELMALIPLARASAAAEEVVPDEESLEARVADAILAENSAWDQDSAAWVARLVRATGPARAEVLTEWAIQRA